jgi:hypothetical protein
MLCRVVTTQPGGGNAGTACATQPVLTVEDSGGRTVLNYNLSVTLTIDNNPAEGRLTSTNDPVAAVAGVATFAGCKINQPGTGYTLKASTTGLDIVSSTFTVTTAGSLSASCSGFPTGSEALASGHWAALLQGWTGTIGTNYPLAKVLAFSSNGSGGFNDLDGICGRTTLQQHFADGEPFVSMTNIPAGPQPRDFGGWLGQVALAG